MRRRIFRSIALCSLGSALLCAAMFFLFFSDYSKTELKNSLQNVRITVVDKSGTVLLDNKNNPANMENHANRPEIFAAFERGMGTSERYSQTENEQYYYCAVKLNDQQVVRLSLSAKNIAAYVNAVFLITFAVAVVIALLCMFAASRLTKGIIQPINQIDLNTGVVMAYPELRPFAEKIELQKNQIDEQLKSLEQSANMRKEFSANVSHELKTPLTTILGYSEILQNDMAKPEHIKEFSGKIRSEASRLLYLIEDIIKLSELDEGGFEVSKQYLDLCEICHEVIDRLGSIAQQKEVHIQFSGKLICLNANAQMMDELLYNIILNAVMYNVPHGKVDVHIYNQKSNVRIDVCDTGIGIPPEHVDRIFERFYRVDRSRSKKTGGTGLGLSIAAHIVEKHGGSISVTSEVNKGTMISILL